MKKSTFKYFLIFLLSFSCISFVYAETEKNTDFIKISNNIFSIYLPPAVKNTYFVKKQKNTILIYDKTSQKAGFGGLAFGIKAYRHPSEHAMMPGGRKIGELTDKIGFIYDMVLIQPTDVQYDYVNGSSDSYKVLYNLGCSFYNNEADEVIIEGVKRNKYYKNQGMKGEDLYKKILQKHITAIKEKWDSKKLEKENMSYMYNVLSANSKNVADKVGYAYYDTNGDGIEELLIGEIAEGSWKGVVYDIYTMVNRKPTHVISGGNRNRYYICNDSFICNEYPAGANENGMNVYILVENSPELYPQVGFKYDGNSEIPSWYISYNLFQDDWENVSEHAFKERKSTFEKYKRFDYIPLSKAGSL